MLYGVVAVGQIDVSEVPANVQKSFNTKYAGAEALDWYKVDDGFEVSIDQDGEMVSAVFSKEAKFLYTYTAVSEEDVPEVIMKGIHEKYADSYISETTLLDMGTTQQYRITVETDEKNLVLTYDKAGKLVNSQEIKNDF